MAKAHVKFTWTGSTGNNLWTDPRNWTPEAGGTGFYPGENPTFISDVELRVPPGTESDDPPTITIPSVAGGTIKIGSLVCPSVDSLGLLITAPTHLEADSADLGRTQLVISAGSSFSSLGPTTLSGDGMIHVDKQSQFSSVGRLTITDNGTLTVSEGGVVNCGEVIFSDAALIDTHDGAQVTLGSFTSSGTQRINLANNVLLNLGDINSKGGGINIIGAPTGSDHTHIVLRTVTLSSPLVIDVGEYCTTEIARINMGGGDHLLSFGAGANVSIKAYDPTGLKPSDGQLHFAIKDAAPATVPVESKITIAPIDTFIANPKVNDFQISVGQYNSLLFEGFSTTSVLGIQGAVTFYGFGIDVADNARLTYTMSTKTPYVIERYAGPGYEPFHINVGRGSLLRSPSLDLTVNDGGAVISVGDWSQLSVNRIIISGAANTVTVGNFVTLSYTGRAQFGSDTTVTVGAASLYQAQSMGYGDNSTLTITGGGATSGSTIKAIEGFGMGISSTVDLFSYGQLAVGGAKKASDISFGSGGKLIGAGHNKLSATGNVNFSGPSAGTLRLGDFSTVTIQGTVHMVGDLSTMEIGLNSNISLGAITLDGGSSSLLIKAGGTFNMTGRITLNGPSSTVEIDKTGALDSIVLNAEHDTLTLGAGSTLTLTGNGTASARISGIAMKRPSSELVLGNNAALIQTQEHVNNYLTHVTFGENASMMLHGLVHLYSQDESNADSTPDAAPTPSVWDLTHHNNVNFDCHEIYLGSTTLNIDGGSTLQLGRFNGKEDSGSTLFFQHGTINLINGTMIVSALVDGGVDPIFGGAERPAGTIAFTTEGNGQVTFMHSDSADNIANYLKFTDFHEGNRIQIYVGNDISTDAAHPMSFSYAGHDLKVTYYTVSTIVGIKTYTKHVLDFAQFYTYDDEGKLDVEWDNASNPRSLVITKCFLPGMLIHTRGGYKRVEDVLPGDEIATYNNGTMGYQFVKWVGSQEINLYGKIEENFPVRIRKGAIADNVPSEDLVLTPEHSLYLDGKLVPVRMLVNGISIAYDRTNLSFTVYHVETEEHSIIIANNVPTESYLDTGDRRKYLSGGNVTGIGPAKTWDKDGAAPLTVERSFVEPIYHRLKARAEALGMSSERRPVELTNDADLHLVTDRGTRLDPIRHDGSMVYFLVPRQTRWVDIVSRASRPVDVVGPFLDDRRKLGVLVGGINLWTGSREYRVESYLRDEDLTGWHAKESADASSRWTDGAARLVLGELNDSKFASTVGLKILAAGPYVKEEEAVTEGKGALSA